MQIERKLWRDYERDVVERESKDIVLERESGGKWVVALRGGF